MFILDPRKWLFTPFDCCALLYRERESRRIIHSIHLELRHFHQMNHGCRAGDDWRPCGVVAKALVGLWVWARWW